MHLFNNNNSSEHSDWITEMHDLATFTLPMLTALTYDRLSISSNALENEITPTAAPIFTYTIVMTSAHIQETRAFRALF